MWVIKRPADSHAFQIHRSTANSGAIAECLPPGSDISACTTLITALRFQTVPKQTAQQTPPFFRTDQDFAKLCKYCFTSSGILATSNGHYILCHFGLCVRFFNTSTSVLLQVYKGSYTQIICFIIAGQGLNVFFMGFKFIIAVNQCFFKLYMHAVIKMWKSL